jgi:hypothetical protein
MLDVYCHSRKQYNVALVIRNVKIRFVYIFCFIILFDVCVQATNVLCDMKCDVLTRLVHNVCRQCAYNLCDMKSMMTLKDTLSVQDDLRHIVKVLVANASFVDYSSRRAMYVLLL